MALTIGTSAPPFLIRQADGSRFDLAPSLGRDRILIALLPSLEWLRKAAARHAQLEDYELQIVAVAAPEVLASAPPPSAWLHVGASDLEVLGLLRARADDQAAIVVGEDRGVKKNYVGEADLDEVLALIDTMPMRRDEVARR